SSSTRSRSGRRIDLLANGYAVSDASLLYIYGYIPGLAGTPFWENDRKEECRPRGRPRSRRLTSSPYEISSFRKIFVSLYSGTGVPAMLYQNYLSLGTIDPPNAAV